MDPDFRRFLPKDEFAGTLVGRAWAPAKLTGTIGGPSPVLIHKTGVYDLTLLAPTCSDLLNAKVSVADCDLSRLRRLASYAEIMANTMAQQRDPLLPYFLSPIDLQAIKACGVTFAVSLLERVIEERAAGDVRQAKTIREKICARIGDDIARVKPGSPQAEALKSALKPTE